MSISDQLDLCQISSMRVVSSCGCEGGVGGKEGLVEAFVKW